MLKRIYGALVRSLKNSNYQKRALKKFEDLEAGKVKILPPKYPSEIKHFERAQTDIKAKKDLEEKHEDLINNMNKFTINSTEPVERWTSTKELPTWESEWMHRNDPVWEYGFYEPSPEKIPENKLMFREALEVMRAYMELDPATESTDGAQEEARKVLDEHNAVKRVSKEKLERMWEYFRPFERRDVQNVVKTADLITLQKAMHGFSDERRAIEVESIRERMKKIFSMDREAKRAFDDMEPEEQIRFINALKERRQIEHDRLTQRLEELNAENLKAAGIEEQKHSKLSAGMNKDGKEEEETKESEMKKKSFKAAEK
ncbi:hypothetical protein AB6A40_002155 [Gnathostoma spinigerum]|uniref:39S ribosomal protein L59, mitochondrial n=1 Tax=Gnathostoma spinigerum TaxID=75299 RepID=A0ABD6EDI7_9BILA